MYPSGEREWPVVGDSGHCDTLEHRFHKLEEENKALRARDEAQKTEISLLKIRVATLTEAQDDNCDVEQDSLDAFEGIGPGLGSEAVPHATLFSLGDSDDVDLFRRIYHFSPTEIQQIHERQDVLSIFVINQRSTLIAAPTKVVPPALESAFQIFVKTLETEWGTTVDLGNKQSQLTQAYWQFRVAYDYALQKGSFGKKRVRF